MLLAGLEIPIATAVRAIERGARAGMRVILNPAPVPESAGAITQGLLSLVDVLTPNRLEALALAGLPATRVPNRTGTSAPWAAAGGAHAVVITLGDAGCLVATPGNQRRVAAPRVRAIDTVGAGDAFNGALAVALDESGRSRRPRHGRRQRRPWPSRSRGRSRPFPIVKRSTEWRQRVEDCRVDHSRSRLLDNNEQAPMNHLVSCTLTIIVAGLLCLGAGGQRNALGTIGRRGRYPRRGRR